MDWKPIWDLDVIVLANVKTKGLNYGQVKMLAGTVLGEAPQGQTAFWEDPGWKDMLVAAINWSAGK